MRQLTNAATAWIVCTLGANSRTAAAAKLPSSGIDMFAAVQMVVAWKIGKKGVRIRDRIFAFSFRCFVWLNAEVSYTTVEMLVRALASHLYPRIPFRQTLSYTEHRSKSTFVCGRSLQVALTHGRLSVCRTTSLG